mmetsp:Transcript_27921/g.33955  ORF Transcript_27921/g.33955 Transcript_27921/m.33955 type:complete len:105 (-) Transcript_27921:189-503(-)
MHCFDIIPLDTSGCRKRRRFAAPADERGDWVYAINLALATYQCMRNDVGRRTAADTGGRPPLVSPSLSVSERRDSCGEDKSMMSVHAGVGGCRSGNKWTEGIFL